MIRNRRRTDLYLPGVTTDPTLHIQTHLAENPAEIEFTRQLFPFADTYTQGKKYPVTSNNHFCLVIG